MVCGVWGVVKCVVVCVGVVLLLWVEWRCVCKSLVMCFIICALMPSGTVVLVFNIQIGFLIIFIFLKTLREIYVATIEIKYLTKKRMYYTIA